MIHSFAPSLLHTFFSSDGETAAVFLHAIKFLSVVKVFPIFLNQPRGNFSKRSHCVYVLSNLMYLCSIPSWALAWLLGSRWKVGDDEICAWGGRMGKRMQSEEGRKERRVNRASGSDFEKKEKEITASYAHKYYMWMNPFWILDDDRERKP